VDNLVQSVLNNSLSMRLKKWSPKQVFTGQAEATPLALMLEDNVPVKTPPDFVKKRIEVEKLSKTMTDVHVLVTEKSTRDRKAAIQEN
jgi:hypothetical protein